MRLLMHTRKSFNAHKTRLYSKLSHFSGFSNCQQTAKNRPNLLWSLLLEKPSWADGYPPVSNKVIPSQNWIVICHFILRHNFGSHRLKCPEIFWTLQRHHFYGTITWENILFLRVTISKHFLKRSLEKMITLSKNTIFSPLI